MYDLFILTTSIDRPDLHTKTLNPFFQHLNDQNLNYLWMCNLDSVFNKSNEALLNFEKLNVDRKIIRQANHPCFFSAADYLVKSSKNFLNELKVDGKILWLEDDWLYNIHFDMNSILSSNYDYIGFHFHHLFEFSLNPTMWSKDFFLNNVYLPFTINSKTQDPEKLLIDYHKKERGVNSNHFKDISKISFNGVFKDAGRDWMKEFSDKKKWKKNKEFDSITYV